MHAFNSLKIVFSMFQSAVHRILFIKVGLKITAGVQLDGWT